MEENEKYKPEPISLLDNIVTYWLSELVEQQKETNELLRSLVIKSNPKPIRKKKEGDE